MISFEERRQLIADYERDYQPRTWKKVSDDERVEANVSGSPTVCAYGVGSEAANSMIALGHKPILWDYEVMEVGHEPTAGGYLSQLSDGRLFMCIFSKPPADAQVPVVINNYVEILP